MNERHRQKRLMALRYVLAIPRSIRINYSLLPWRQAWHLPILIARNTVIENLSGKINIEAPKLRMGLFKIGFSTYQGTDTLFHRTRLNLRGTIVVAGESDFGTGSSVEVSETGVLTLGHMSHVGPQSLLVCHKSVSLGSHARISWCCTLMDTDQHVLVDASGMSQNADRPIALGENVWVGCHTIITKGTILPNNTTVGAGSVVHGRFDEECTVLAGNPARVVKKGVRRD
ncbi:MAG: hypothetical protein KBT28_03010 [Bacteroidales bacterium]|nr:hypothetical protein [Candidatus Colimorpha merdihippi]